MPEIDRSLSLPQTTTLLQGIAGLRCGVVACWACVHGCVVQCFDFALRGRELVTVVTRLLRRIAALLLGLRGHFRWYLPLCCCPFNAIVNYCEPRYLAGTNSVTPPVHCIWWRQVGIQQGQTRGDRGSG